MGHIVSTIGTAAGVFAGTDIDDILVLTVLFLASRASGRPTTRAIIAGQYLGIAVLVAVGWIGAAGVQMIPLWWAGLLGLVPLALGVRGLVSARRSGDGPPDRTAAATGTLSVAAITIANGGDNLSAYIPLFRTIGPRATVITVAVFAVMVAIWLAVARLGSNKYILRVIERTGHWLVPIVYIAIGTLILIRTGVIARLATAR